MVDLSKITASGNGDFKNLPSIAVTYTGFISLGGRGINFHNVLTLTKLVELYNYFYSQVVVKWKQGGEAIAPLPFFPHTHAEIIFIN